MNKKVFNCNVELTIDIIKGKWRPLIFNYIGVSGVIRYGELKRAIPEINERVLSRELRALEECHLIHRKIYNELPLKVEYSLTELGETLLPILTNLGEWGKQYNAATHYGEIYVSHECEN